MKVTDNEGKTREITCPKCRSTNTGYYQTIARQQDGRAWVCKDCGELFDD